ncbi:MAG: GldG family protein [Spirochaetia bacterium]|jgi:gliding-associated putative ABC transporter substrate-binding component GldG|nr:GldG family protein [Spirochaetia bacterium]
MQINKLKEIILIVLTTIIFLLIALNSVIFFNRLDLTENKSFTLSSATKKIISSIPEKVHITYYISDKIKTITPVATEIEDLLMEYAAHSKGSIDTVSIDPGKYNLTTKAQNLGVQPQQIEVVEKNEQTYAMVYSGITIQYLDKYETIPFILNLESLEYELTNKIRKMVENLDPTITVIIGDSRRTMESHYKFLKEKVEMSYKLEIMEKGIEIPMTTSVLAVLGNKDLSEGDMLYIDDYIINGGKVLFCLDGVDVDMMNNFTVLKLEDSPALGMLEKYGVKIKNDIVLDKYSRRIPLRGSFPLVYPQWIGITPQNVSKENPVTSRFAGLDLLWASSIEILEKMENVKYEKILSSTDQAWTMENNISANPYEVSLAAAYTGDDQRQLDLGYVVTGPFKSAYTEKTGVDTRIMVIGDSDYLSDIIQFSDSPYNIMFFENAVEWLANDESLIQIKTKSKRDLRLNKIETPEGQIKAIMFVYLVNIVIVPVLIIVFAIVRFIGRKRKES